MNISNHAPRVTCIILTHNRMHVIDRAIDSVLSQSYKNCEIVVIDDGSSDQTYEYLINRYAGTDHFTIVRNEKSLGPSGARNRALKSANGEYVSFLDDDDQWLPEKIEKQIELAKRDYDFITMTRARYAISGNLVTTYGPKLHKITLNDLFKRNMVISVSPLVKTSLMRQVRFDPNLWCGEDYDAWIRLLNIGVKTVNLNDPLVVLHKDADISLNQIRQNKFQGRMQIYFKHKSLMKFGEKLRFHLMTALKFVFPDPRYYKNRMKQFIGNLK